MQEDAPQVSAPSGFTLNGSRDALGLLRTTWLHILLFALTLLSTTQFGAALAHSFAQGHPLDENSLALSYHWLLHFDRHLALGLSYSGPLLLILSAHEMGHYVACRKWRVDATLPFFGPSPTLLGTVGAFIWIRSPIYNRRTLFDIGVSGPVCGFAMLLPCLVVGVWESRVAVNAGAMVTFGTPLLVRIVETIRFPGASPAAILLHPTAVAAWAGLLATAINLLPIGQLDGGHILYSVLGERWHSTLSLAVLGMLAIAGTFYWPWWAWAVALFFFRRHPAIYDDQPVSPVRRWLSLFAILILALSFVPVPVRVA